MNREVQRETERLGKMYRERGKERRRIACILDIRQRIMLKWFTFCMKCLLALNTYCWPQVNMYADKMSSMASTIWIDARRACV